MKDWKHATAQGSRVRQSRRRLLYRKLEARFQQAVTPDFRAKRACIRGWSFRMFGFGVGPLPERCFV